MGIYRRHKTKLLTLVLIIAIGMMLAITLKEMITRTVHTLLVIHDVFGELRKSTTIHYEGIMGKKDDKTKETIDMFLKKPCPASLISDTDIRYSQANQDVTVYNLIRKKNGYFIEIGGFDGKTWSNTLWLERRHNWTGLLIEANPDNCHAIDKLQRNIWRLCACLSSSGSTTFLKNGAEGSIYEFIPKEKENTVDMSHVIFVPCFNISEILKKIKQFRIDYFSLDVEGAEREVLNNMKKELQLKTLIVDVWTIEYRVWDGKQIVLEKSMHNLAMLRNFFKEVGGYIEHSHLSNTNDVTDGMALDVVFVNRNTWCRTYQTKPDGSKCDR
ncbi:uncharacterized protein LOC127737451 [Mytilus californianus]|uniref:uncharacterized protein LOC127737451 n=1 Tax=Mytilus californianus TaxID=6549 RepID=UPI002247BA27|nr:uncharacterized protein LOC127737451 [Mytilus californianus]